MKNPGKKLSYLFLLFSILALTTSSVYAQESGESNANLKAIHLSPNAGPIDVSVDGETQIEELEFGQSVYIDLNEPGVHEIGTNTRASQSFNFSSGRSYSFIVRNFAPSVESNIVSNQRKRVPDGLAQVRIAQYSPDLLDVDVSVENGNSYSINSLSYAEFDSYTRVRPGTYTVTVRNSRTNRVVFSEDIELRAGRAYSGFIAGASPGRSDRGFQIVRVIEKIPDTENGEGNGDNGDEDETPEEFVYRCVVVSDDPRRLECRVYR